MQTSWFESPCGKLTDEHITAEVNLLSEHDVLGLLMKQKAQEETLHFGQTTCSLHSPPLPGAPWLSSEVQMPLYTA